MPGVGYPAAFTYVFSSCQFVLLVGTSDRKTLVNSESFRTIWGSKIKSNSDRWFCQQVDFIKSQPKFPCQITKAILILDPLPVTEPNWTVKTLLNYDPASFLRDLVAVDWEGVVTPFGPYNVDSTDIKPRLAKLLAVRINYWRKTKKLKMETPSDYWCGQISPPFISNFDVFWLPHD